MKAPMLVLALLSAWSLTAYAQETAEPLPESFPKTFSLELGGGVPPLHMALVSQNLRYDEALADEGKEVDGQVGIPALSVSFVWQTTARWQFALTGGASWAHGRIYQHETFGIDPQGKPRYDLNRKRAAGVKILPAGSLTLQARCFWNPKWKVRLYSGFGFGLALGAFDAKPRILPAPSLTPVGAQFGTGHFYAFLENSYSPYALLGQAGLGWRF